ncbi:MAG: hypothetical protein COT84_07505 [Chlamydiae bacterium CG10_big_fil_rev_8_21_14_0_10_35_9]|nr:MAG: hypothetical protein COT84_07505 [Chlamydiae bacterium CG10_big_fil_rev_8_21_14_0_10_35_9]
MPICSQKQIVFIAGASRGIGLATAYHLSQQGYIVYGTYNKSQPPSDSITESRITFFQMDITDVDNIEKIVNQILSKESKVDVVINCAAIGIYGPAEEVSIEQAQNMFDVNVFGIMRVMQRVLPQFRKQGKGLIINISSMAALDPIPGSDWYASSKYALEGLTESMASYLQNQHIHLVLVEPGPVNTDFISKSSQMADITLPDDPYNGMSETVYYWHKKALSKGQDPNEIAQLIEEIILTPLPQLRYQTSCDMQKIAQERYVDPSGNSFLENKREFTNSLD